MSTPEASPGGALAPDLDVVALGNAIVDILTHEDDAFLDQHDLVKGSMRLVDAADAGTLYGAMGPAIEVSGGSAANTVVGIASLGGRAAFIGKVRDDQLGAVFTHDLRASGVEFATPPATDGQPTAQSLIVVTPDAQRTMSTFLGAATGLRAADVDPGVITRAAVTYLEGYLWDPPEAKEAFRAAMRLAHDAGRKVALTLSDAFCVDRYRSEFVDLVDGGVDILFANEAEITSLYECDFDTAVTRVRDACEVVAVTRSEKGSLVVMGGDAVEVPAAPTDVQDTTGAGDLYAAGFLYGLTHGWDAAGCGQLGSLCAAEVISHLGARPAVALADLVGEVAHP